MLGHRLYASLHQEMACAVTVRSDFDALRHYGLFCHDEVFPNTDATDLNAVSSAIERFRPDVVVNCIGIVKQHPLAKDPIASLTINSLFPHQVGKICAERDSRFIHISTDCVFTGAKGNYTEENPTDADDLYGKSKAMGETTAPNALTLRTSIIGRELVNGTGLVEWFLQNADQPVKGYTEAKFSGLTTHELSRAIRRVITDHPDLTGLYQVAAAPIDKCSLLHLIRDAYRLDTPIHPDDAVRIDRTLNGSRFAAATGYTAPSWPEMVASMAADTTPYTQWR